MGLVHPPDQAIRTLVPTAQDGSVSRYFLPFRPNVRVTYAKTAAFQDAGVTVPVTDEDFVRAASALKGADGRPKVTLSLAEGDPAAVTLCELILSYGGDPLKLNDPGSIEAFRYLELLWRNALLPPASFQAKWDTEVENLADGTASMAENWSFTSADLAKEGKLDEFQVYAGWSGPHEAHVIGGDVLGIPKGVRGKELEAAIALAEFLMPEESQELLVRRNAWPSFRSDVDYGSLPAEQGRTFEAIQKALASGWYRPVVPYWPVVSEQLNLAVIAVLLEGKPVKAVLDEAHARIRAAAAGEGAPYP